MQRHSHMLRGKRYRRYAQAKEELDWDVKRDAHVHAHTHVIVHTRFTPSASKEGSIPTSDL